MIRLALFALLILASPWLRAAGDELLEPEKAFLFSARMVDDKTAEVRFKVAKGYYLYRHKLKFAAEPAWLGKAQLPGGKFKEDEFFGKVEIYPADFQVRIPLTKATAGKSFTLKAEYQGCAEVGVCYPPQQSEAVLKVPAAAKAEPPAPIPVPPKAAATPAPGAAQDPDLINRLRKLAGDYPGSQAQAEFMPPDEAFQLTLTAGPDHTLLANFTIAPGHYLYRDKIKLVVSAPAGVAAEAPQLPAAEEKNDANFGRMYIYHQSFSASARLTGLPPEGATVVVEASYQGCSELGICYPPIDKTITLPITADAAAPAPMPKAPTPVGPQSSDSDKIASLLEGGSFWLVVVSFFGFGLLLSLTPCVFPMIPILSGIIVGQGHHITKRKGFMLSLAYVLGMAITYALAGVAAGMSGTLISNALQNPWALSAGAAVFVALAFSMFGFYDIQLPSFLQSRFTEASNRVRGGNLVGVFIMGALSALIVGPCVAAPLAGALLYIGQTSNVVLGGVSLFSLALGMGVPLLLVGLSAGALLPRAGGWMEAVKKFFGVLLLAVAIWLIAPLLSEVAQMLIWSALLTISGVYLRAVDPLTAHANGWQRFWKGVGIITLIAGIAMLLGALGGGRDPLQPLSIYKGGSADAQDQGHLVFARVRTVAELDQAIVAAQGKPVMLDFYADWCTSCKEMERFTFSDAKVQARLKDVVLLQADVTGNTADDKALLKRFSLFGPPGLIFFDPAGQEIAYRVIGYEPADQFLASLGKAIP